MVFTVQVINFAISEHGDDHTHDHADSCPTGHAHIYLDGPAGTLLGMAYGPTVDLTIPADTTPGPHEVVAVLQDTTHAPLNPSVEKKLSVTVQ